MPLYLNEFLGYDPNNKNDAKRIVSAKNLNKIKSTNITEAEANGLYRPDFNIKIEAIHADFGTRNFTRYKEKCLHSMLESWTNPYNAPIIMYHNDYDGEIVGRVTKASIEPSSQIPTKALILEANIPDWDAQRNVRTQILSTVSIGVSAKDVRCSICGTQLSDNDTCEHYRGHVYEGEICYWDVYDAEAKECSFVIIPSDKYAQVVSIKEEEGNYPVSVSAPKASPTIWIPNGTEAAHQDISKNINIQETAKTQEGKSHMDIKEAEAKINSLGTEIMALKGDKKSLQESIDALNNDKVKLQESVANYKAAAEKQELAAAHEKELREAAESKVENLEKEVRTSLAESLATLRDKAGKPAIEKLEERSIESLRDSISDIKTELAEAAKLLASKENAKDKDALKDTRGTIKDTSLKESDTKDEPETIGSVESFDL